MGDGSGGLQGTRVWVGGLESLSLMEHDLLCVKGRGKGRSRLTT